MATLLNPASSKYLLNPAPGFLHNEVTAWLSELAFIETEIQFLSKLLNSAFLRATSKEKIIELSDLDKKVKDFKTKNLDTLKQALANHEHELSLLDMDTFKTEKGRIEEAHHQLHWDFDGLTENVKKIKKEIFGVVEKQFKLAKKVTAGYEEGSLSL